MKKIFLFVMMFVSIGAFAQADYEGYLINTNGNGLQRDTLTNTDTTKYNVTITGPKSTITFQIEQLKLTGTVAGKISIIAGIVSNSGVIQYMDDVVIADQTITDASKVWRINLTNNQYKYYQVRVISSGTNTQSNRCYLLYRHLP